MVVSVSVRVCVLLLSLLKMLILLVLWHDISSFVALLRPRHSPSLSHVVWSVSASVLAAAVAAVAVDEEEEEEEQ